MQNSLKDVIKSKYLSAHPYLTSKKSKGFFGIVLTLCALSFFGYFAISPAVSTILELQKELKDNQFVLSQLEKKVVNLNELKKQYSLLQSDLPVVTSAIPILPYPNLLFAQIQSVAKTSNIIINRLQNSEIEILKNGDATSGDHSSYSFTIEGSGSQSNIYKFTKEFTNMERVIDIDSFSFSGNSAASTLDNSKFNIQGTAFFKNDL